MARILSGDDIEICDLSYPDLVPLSLGIETAGGFFTRMIPRNYWVPITKTRTFVNAHDNQEKVLLKIYEGDREFVKDNKLLGSLELELDRARKKMTGEVEVEVAFVFDWELGLSVTAWGKGAEVIEGVNIGFGVPLLPHERAEEVEGVLRDMEEFYEMDLREKAVAIEEKRWTKDNGFGVVEPAGSLCWGNCGVAIRVPESLNTAQ